MYNIIPMGTLGSGETTVSEKNTAKTLGSGGLDVFATPAMILLMENTAAESVAKFLDENFSTVGTKIDIKHLSPSPIGAKNYMQYKSNIARPRENRVRGQSF